MGEHEQDTAPFMVVSDRPVELHNAVRRARLALVLLVAGILLAATAGGWFGFELGARHTDARIGALERDQQQRAAARSAQIEQLRTTACVVLDRLQPDPEVDRQRALFGCGPYVPQPTPSLAVPAPQAVPTRPGVSPQPAPPGGTPPPASPAPVRPAPRPTPNPAPAPPPAGHLCLPILGCVL